MKNRKRKIVVTICLTLAITLIAIGVSFAFVSYTKTGQRYNIIKSGSINFSFVNSNTIWLQNAVPIDIVEASKLEVGASTSTDQMNGGVFQFTISNSANNDTNYVIYIERTKDTAGTYYTSQDGTYSFTINSESKQFSPYVIGINVNTDTTGAIFNDSGFGGETYSQAATANPNNTFIPSFSNNASQVEYVSNQIKEVVNYRRENWTTEFPWLSSVPEYPTVTREQYLFNPLVYTPYMTYYTDPANYNPYDLNTKTNPNNIEINDFHYFSVYSNPQFSGSDFSLDPNNRLTTEKVVDYNGYAFDMRVPLKYPSYFNLLDLKRTNDSSKVEFQLGTGTLKENQTRYFELRMWVSDEYVNIVPYQDLIYTNSLIQYTEIPLQVKLLAMRYVCNGRFAYDSVKFNEFDEFYFNGFIPIKYYNNASESVLQNQYFDSFYKFTEDILRRYTGTIYANSSEYSDNPNNYKSSSTQSYSINSPILVLDDVIKGYASKMAFAYTPEEYQNMYMSYKIRVEATM